MAPIRRGDGTALAPKGIKEVRKGDGTVIYAPDAIPDSGVSRWTFDDADTSGGTATDIWGSNDGTITGATTGVSGANQTYTTNEAFSFDGTDDAVDITSLDDDWDRSVGSLALWLNADSTGDNWIFVAKASVSERIDLFDSGNLGTTQGDLAFHYETNGNRTNVATTNWASGSWKHIVCTWDTTSANEIALYLDGGLEASTSQSASTTGTSNIYLGRAADGSIRYSGDMDDVRVYDKALSSTEVSNLYNTGSI